GVRIPEVQLPALVHHQTKCAGYARRGRVSCYETDRLRVEVAAETLKLRRDENRIGVIDLERGVSASAATPLYSSMRCLDLVQRTLRIAFPLDQGGGRHASVPATFRGITRLKRPRQNKIALDCKLPSEPGGHEPHSGIIREELVEIGLKGVLRFVVEVTKRLPVSRNSRSAGRSP